MHISLSSFRKTLFFGAVLLFSLLLTPRVYAATLTVCASGCDYTSIGAAFASPLAPNDSIDVQASYVSSSDSYPLTFPAATSSLVLDCQNSGALIGNTGVGQGVIRLNASSTIQNCSFSNVMLSGYEGADSTSTIINNSFATTTTSTISLLGPGTDFKIDNNTGVNNIEIVGNSTGTIIGNTIYNHALGSVGYAIFLGNSLTSLNAIISHNDITLASVLPGFFLAYIDARDVTFHANTIRYLTSPDITHYTQFAVYEAEHLDFTNNYYQMPSNANGMKAFEYWWHGTTTYAFVDHNTFVMPATCLGCFFMYLEAYPGATTSYVTTTNNIFYSASSTGNGRGIEHSVSINDSTSTLNLYNDYNDFWQLGPGQTFVTHNGSTLTLGPNTKYVDPGLKTTDANAANDFELAPYSLLLDVNGSDDIGAYSAARGAVFHIDAAGPIDYSTIDATTTVPIETYTRSGDTWILAPGSYDGFRLATSTDVTGHVTITGSGAATIVNGSTDENAIFFDGVSSSTIDNLVVQNASTTSVAYTMTRPIGVYNGTTYNDASLIGGDPNAAVIVGTSLCNIDQVVSDGADVTSFVGLATSNWNLAMAHTGSAHVSVIVPNNFINSAAAFDAACTGFGLTVDRWVASAFTVNNGSFTYNAAAMAAAGVTIAPGFVDPPHLDRVTVGYAGLKLNSTNNILITNVTSTQNGFGVWLSGTSASTTISSSTISVNSLYDYKDEASGATDLKNVSFLNSSSSISGLGDTSVYYTMRTFVSTTSSAPLAGVTVNVRDAANNATTTLVTAGNGFTPYSDYLLAYIMTSSSILQTGGGNNPYTITSVASSTYAATTTVENLYIPGQTFVLAADTISIPNAPTSVVATPVSSTAILLSWDDVSSGVGQEDHFTINYINSSTGEAFPGTTVLLDSDATSTLMNNLLPNNQYQFRISATNIAGTSGIATSSLVYTLTTTPDAPLVGSPTLTTISIQFGDATNPTTTRYAVYDQTRSVFIDAIGSPSAVAVWQTTSTWNNGIVATGLACGTSYSFSVTARNEDEVVATSSVSSASTLACPIVASDGGGGAATNYSNGGGGSSFIPTFQTAQYGKIINPVPHGQGKTPNASPSYVSEQPQASSTDIVSEFDMREAVFDPTHLDSLLTALHLTRDEQAERKARIQVQSDADSLRLKLQEPNLKGFTNFIAYGISYPTAKLGPKERRALLRDYFEIYHTQIVSWRDLHYIATGRKPVSRIFPTATAKANALIAFKRVYGHAPKSSKEGILFEALLYRLRYPRNISKEVDAIKQFVKVYHYVPKSGLAWSVVRVLTLTLK